MKSIERSNYWIQEKDYDKAIAEISEKAQQDGDDQLLYLLNLGMAHHLARNWDESIQAFLKADAIADIKDYTSLSREAGSVLLNDKVLAYRGDDYEKVLIHIYLSLNFLMKKDLNGALVESRRVNEILQKYRDEAKRSYEQNAFAFYLSALVWEANRDWDDAYIAYHDTYKKMQRNDFLKQDLLRLSKKASRNTDHKKWTQDFSKEIVQKSQEGFQKNQGELVLLYQQGQGPHKQPHPNYQRIPKLTPTPTVAMRASLEVDGRVIQTEELYNLQSVAIASLEEQYAYMIGKRVAGEVAKYAIAHEVSKKDETLGALTFLGLSLLNQVDLRQWSNLPETFQIAKIYLKPGEYAVTVKALDYRGNPTSEVESYQNVKIEPNKMTFLNFRSFK